MPKKAKELTALEVKRLKHPGTGKNYTKAVGGVDGLKIQITPSGARSWLLRCMIAGARREIGLGPFPEVSLADAREKARKIRAEIRDGIDPVEARRQKRELMAAERRRGMTFREAVEKALEARLAEFSNEKHRRQWRSTLDTYAMPELGDMQVSEIAVADVLRVVEPIWASKTETAYRVRGRIESVLAWATVSGHREGDNPARWKGNLNAILPKPSKIASKRHHPAVALGEVADWFADLRKRNGMAARALEFVALTAARSGEAKGATWDEIDLANKVWIIPAARMGKSKREHRVPLSGEAVAFLNALPRFEGSPFVFPAPRGGELSHKALENCMGRVHDAREGGYRDPRDGRPAVPHGLRSTFRDWCAERGVERDMAEIALSHTVGSAVERAYRRSDMFDRRRALMETWARFLLGAEGSVIALGARAAE